MKHQERLAEEETRQKINKILCNIAEILQKEGLITVDERIHMTEALKNEQ